MDAAVESIEMRAHYARRSLEIDQLFDRLKAELPALEEYWLITPINGFTRTQFIASTIKASKSMTYKATHSL